MDDSHEQHLDNIAKFGLQNAIKHCQKLKNERDEARRSARKYYGQCIKLSACQKQLAEANQIIKDIAIDASRSYLTKDGAPPFYRVRDRLVEKAMEYTRKHKTL